MIEISAHQLIVPEDILKKWQHLVDVLARVVGVPAALIMRIADTDIEVFTSSMTEGNPYHPGDREHLLGSGLYCETVIRTQQQLLVPDALADEDWKNNPDVKLNMVSYLGLPLRMDGEKPFGTICILDNKHNAYHQDYMDLLGSFRALIETDLALCYTNQALGEKFDSVVKAMEEVRTLRGLLPTCSSCKRVRDEQGQWHNMEHYVEAQTEAQISHSVCNSCMDELYGGQDWYEQKYKERPSPKR